MSATAAPTRTEIAAVAEEFHLDCSPQDLDQLADCLPLYLADIDTAERLWASEVASHLSPPERSYRVPEPTENPLNAWTVLCSISNGSSGILQGRTVAIKDNVAVAGLPLSAGSATLKDFVADRDAAAVTRILNAGGVIKGMARCENFCLSGGSHTGWGGPVRHPIDPSWSTGGSSSGSAALVASGAVDMAIGSDQGGSIRIPSSFCGIVGLKPTWNAVPYDGAMSMEPNVDHLGPMTATVLENLLLFSALTGQDRSSSDCEEVLASGVEGVRVGRLAEGFGQPNVEPQVEGTVDEAISRLSRAGALVREIAIPTHRIAPVLWTAIGLGGLQRGLLNDDAWGLSSQSEFPPSWPKRFRDARRREFCEALRTKQFMIAAALLHRKRGPEPYAFSRTAASVLRDHYDAAFNDVDVLAMPTTPHAAAALPDADNLKASNFAAESMASNTSPFNLTHHPALSVPCGFAAGRPVGLMLVGRHGAEDLLYRVAAAVEQRVKADRSILNRSA